MPGKQFAALLALSVLAAGCGGEAEKPEPAPASTITLTSAPPSPTTKPTPKEPEVGQKLPFNDVGFSTGTVAVLKFRQPLASTYPPERAGYEFAGVEIQRCYKSITTEDGVRVSWAPWTLNYKNGNIIEPPSSWSAEHFSVQLYPRDHLVKEGECIRGWIPYEVPKGSSPATVSYVVDSLREDWAVR